MRVEKRKKLMRVEHEIFVANDGTRFSKREDCEKYEENFLKRRRAKAPLFLVEIKSMSKFGVEV